MLIKPFGEVFDRQEENVYYQSYVGEVVDNNDPLKLKRVKVNIELWNYMNYEDLPWVKQAGDGSVGNSPMNTTHNIPEIGSQVSVSFPSGDPDDPQYSGVETTIENKCSLFDEDYPNTYGSMDSSGNFSITNKKTGIVVKQHKSGTQLQIDNDGTATLTMPSGAYAYCDASGTWFFKGPKCTIAMDDEIKLAASNINLIGDTVKIQGEFVDISADNQVSQTSSVISLNGGSSVLLNTPKATTTKALIVGNGVSDQFIDILSSKMYTWQDGILTSVTGG